MSVYHSMFIVMALRVSEVAINDVAMFYTSYKIT